MRPLSKPRSRHGIQPPFARLPFAERPFAQRRRAAAALTAMWTAIFRDPSFEAVSLFSLFGLVVSLTVVRLLAEHPTIISIMFSAN